MSARTRGGRNTRNSRVTPAEVQRDSRVTPADLDLPLLNVLLICRPRELHVYIRMYDVYIYLK